MSCEKILSVKAIFIFMAVWAFLFSILPANALAMPVWGTQSSSYIGVNRQQDIEAILKLFDNTIAAKKFLLASVDREALRQRLEKLDEFQLHSLALKSQKIRVAGDVGATILIISVVILVIVAILYATDYAIKIEPKH